MKKYGKSEAVSIQTLEESKDSMDVLCNLTVKSNDLRFVHFILFKHYIYKIVPIVKDIEESTSKFIKGQILTLFGLTSEFEVLIEEIIMHATMGRLMTDKLITVAIEMFNDSDSSPRLKISILYIIFSCMKSGYWEENPERIFITKSSYDEAKKSIHQLALSVVNSNGDSSTDIYVYANKILNILSTHNPLYDESVYYSFEEDESQDLSKFWR